LKESVSQLLLTSQIGQRCLDPRVTPRGIVLRQSPDQFDIFLQRTRTALPTPMAVVPPDRDQFPIPSHQRVRGKQGLQSTKTPARRPLGISRHLTTLRIGEANRPVTRALVANMVLLLQVLDDLQLMTDNSTRGQHEQQLQSRRKREHGR
jgi:hypothetical protein